MSLGFGIVGVGRWGRFIGRVLSDHPAAEVVAVCDADPARARQAAAELGRACRVHGRPEDLAGAAEVAAVVVATPDHLHFEPVAAAIRAAKHVLVEKPLAISVAECEQIGRLLAASNRVRLMVDRHNRWSPPFRAAHQAVRSGALGAVRHIYFRLSDAIRVPTQWLSWAAETSVLHFLGTHAVDTIRWLTGSEVVRVRALAREGVLTSRGIDTPDLVVAMLELDSGATAILEHAWILPDSMPQVYDLKCEIVGERGHIEIDPSTGGPVRLATADGAAHPDVLVAPEFDGRPWGFAAESIRHFVDCLVEDREPAVGIEEGLAAARVIASIERAYRSGRTVPVD